METRSKSLRGATVPDAGGRNSVASSRFERLATHLALLSFTPVEVRAPPVLHSVEADAEQHQGQSSATRPGHFTLV